MLRRRGNLSNIPEVYTFNLIDFFRKSVHLPAGGGTFLFRQESTQRGGLRGSDPTAAGGRKREGNEWQRSAEDAGACTKETAGYRNRTAGASPCPTLLPQARRTLKNPLAPSFVFAVLHLPALAVRCS